MTRAKSRATGAMVPWADVRICQIGDSEVSTTLGDHPRYAAEWRRTGAIDGVFLVRVGRDAEDGEDASTWGPATESVDWSGLDDAIASSARARAVRP